MTLSGLGRLFAYAREGANEARENFTTEALATASRSDAAPFVDVLRAAHVLSWNDTVSDVAVATQIPIAGSGIIDLGVLLVLQAHRLDFWIEVKVGSGESGSQLANYSTFVETLPRASRPTLLTLSPKPLRTGGSVPWIPWQSLWWSIDSVETESPYWLDFRAYLEEIGMADQGELPITALESLSLKAAGSLVIKTHRILWAFSERGRARWPRLRWPNDESELNRDLHQQFRVHSRLMFYSSTGSRAFPLTGVVPADGDEADLIVAVESPPKRTDMRRSILETADAGGLGQDWVRKLDGWWGLRRRSRIVSFATHEHTVDWLVESFSDLDAAGLLDFLPTLGATIVATDEVAPSNGGATG